jgi:signal transduction histidine kinase
MHRAQWLSTLTRHRDVGLALALTALGEAELFGHEKYHHRPVWPGPVWVNAVLIVALTLPFAWRRTRPLTTVAAVVAVTIGSTIALGASEAATTFVVLIVVVFSGTAYSRHVIAVVALGVACAAVHGLDDRAAEGLTDLTWTYGLVAISALLGRAVWLRQHRIGTLEQDAELTAEQHTREIAEATAAERASIARELHDIVSHAVSVIVIQSQAGARALPHSPDVVQTALAAIEASARTAMDELRQLLQLLTPDDTRPATTPMASLRQLDELVDQCRGAGLDVDVDGEAPYLDPVADLAAYRIVQEALTNTMRHAPGARARISLRATGGMLEIVASDSGSASGDPRDSNGNGRVNGKVSGAERGLIGMRERLALAGGQLTEAARHRDGYRLRALVPIREPRADTVAVDA